MIKARTAFNLRSPLNSPLYGSYPPVHRSALRFLSQNSPNHRRFRRIQIDFCVESSFNSISKDESPHKNCVVYSGDESVNNATWIGVAALTSKILGLLREVTMASVFGVGPIATAFKYAWVVPGFSSSLLGGVNGPIHVIMATTLSKLPKERGKKLFRHMTTIMFMVGAVVGAFVYIFPEFIIHIYAPGLWILAEGQIIRELAIQQLKIMTPCIVLAGPVGLGFGYMSAEGNNILPSISPAFSSSLLIVSCLIYTFTRRLNAAFSGGSFVSVGVSLGLLIQWIIQVIVLGRSWSDIIPDSLINILTSGDVFEFFSLLLPATVSSGLAQIASLTDLCFASPIPGAAAGLSYAYLMVMAPLGALSTIIILPLVPTFSKLVKTSSWESIVENLICAVLLCMVIILPIFSTMRILAKPIIHVLLERFAFDSSAGALVSTLFLAYSYGAPFFIVRDLLVTVFYALGDGKGPFLVSAAAIALNAVLDWLSVSRFNLGAQGLRDSLVVGKLHKPPMRVVGIIYAFLNNMAFSRSTFIQALSTSFTAAISVVLLFHLLQRKLPGLPSYGAMIYPTILLLSCCITSNLSTSTGYILMGKLWSFPFLSRYCLMKELLAVSLASAIGVIGFFAPVFLLHLFGVELVRDLYRILIKQQSLRPVVKFLDS